METLIMPRLKYAEEATRDLQLKLVPQEQWPGIDCVLQAPVTGRDRLADAQA